jgi:hypothetical protein
LPAAHKTAVKGRNDHIDAAYLSGEEVRKVKNLHGLDLNHHITQVYGRQANSGMHITIDKDLRRR